MKKIVFSIALFGYIYAGVDYKVVDTSKLNKIKINTILSMMAEKGAKAVPITMDSATKITRILSYDNNMVYEKMLDTDNDVVNNLLKDTQSVKKRAFERDSNYICSDPLIRYFIVDRGAIYIYRWRNKKSQLLFEYSINKKDCLKR